MKKILKYTGIGLVSLAVFGSLAFTAFVYNVFEGSVVDIRTGIPRTVDFYLGKRGLAGDFTKFPEPQFWSRFESGPAYVQLRRSKLHSYALNQAGLGQALEELERVQDQLAEIPLLNVTILGDVLGEDLAIAGRLRGSGQPPTWASYARVSWKICSFYNLLGYSLVREKMANQGLALSLDGDLVQLQPPGAPVLWMARVLDLIILGNDKDFVAESRALAAGELAKDTLQVSPDYQDLVLGQLDAFAERQGFRANAVELNLDLTRLARDFPAFAAWPGEGPDLSQESKLLGSFVQTKAMRALWGAIDFNEDSISALLTIDMNRNELTPQQTSFYSTQPGDVNRWLRPKLRCIPSTAAGFLMLRLPVQLFLEEFVASLEKDARDLIDEGLRRSGQRGGVRGLIESFARGLKPYVLVIIRNNDYPKFQTEYEVKIPSPAPAVAWVVEVRKREQERIDQVLGLLRKNYRRFGFQSQYEINTGPGGAVRIDEWPSTNIPGTGQIAILEGGSQLGDLLMLSNSGKLLQECVRSYFNEKGARSIGTNERLLENIQRMGKNEKLSGFAWVEGENVRGILSRYLQFALDAVRSNEPDPNWMIVNRPAVERRIFEQEFKRKAASKFELRGADREAFEKRVSDVLGVRWQSEGQGRGQQMVSEFEDMQRYLEFLDAAYLLIRSEPRRVECELRAFLRY
ncbi:MAG: hypothetical protein CSA62_05850 [Planctomycetota bacterium]|nr:MAG: hypothetical protein CSA62_05850 [Planctomycetota bacterium]